VETVRPPRPGAIEHARAIAAHALVHRAHRLDVLAGRARPQGFAGCRWHGQARRRPAGHHVRLGRTDAVAEAPVDPRLRGPQRRDRLATRTDIFELASHHRRQQAAPPVRRDDRHGRHSGAADRRPGHRQRAGERHRRRDDPAVVEPRQRALRLVDLLVARAILVAELAMKGRHRGVAEVVELLARGRAQLHAPCVSGRERRRGRP
jgi:hypothetical protein